MELIAATLTLIAAILSNTTAQEPQEAVQFDCVKEAHFEAPIEEAPTEAQEEPIEQQEETEVYYEPDYGYAYEEQVEYPYTSEGYVQETQDTQQEALFSSGLTRQSGVNYYDGRTETYYSSNVLYHYRTGEWTVDDEGFYRTDEGYYVVAASDMPQGTVFQGSKGECIVLDCGCADGVTDYYVNWS